MPPKHWQSTSTPLTQALRPIAAMYGWLWSMRSALYRMGILRSKHLSVPVVVVGNVVAGGAGKTPIVIALVQRLQTENYKVGIISRGYGRDGSGCTEVTKYSAASDVGDEPVLLHRTTGSPVFVAKNRVQAAQTLLAQYPDIDIIVSDDGLQHLALHRDIEVVVFDERGVGNGMLLPAGPLREPWPRKPYCAAHLVLNDVKRQIGTYAINGKGERITLSKLHHKTMHALAAIAKPDVFFDMLRAKGLVLASTQSYPDHDSLKRCKIPSQENEVLLCTAKDAVKLWQHHPQVLAIPLLIELNETFLKVFDASIHALKQPA